MEFDKYRLEATFSPDRSSVSHTIYRDNHPPTATVWTTTRSIGRGGNGVVDLQSEPSGLVRAVKRIYERDSDMKKVLALSKVSDRRDLFVEFFGWYEDQQSLYIAMEYVANGDLGVYIKTHQKSQIPEATCQEISRQLLEALQVLHERLICHRDLKPQNVLVAALEPIHVKMTDFGVSKYLNGTECRTRVGTTGYMAPEMQGFWVLPRRRRRPLFTNAVDLWAAGCIIHELLSLQLPFASEWEDDPDITMTGVYSAVDPEQVPAETDNNRLMEYCKGQSPLPVEALERSGVSPNPIELLRALLKADPAARMTAMEALKAPWFPEKHLTGPVEPTTLNVSTSETLYPSHPQFVELEAPPLWETEPPPGELTTPTNYRYMDIAIRSPPSSTGAVYGGSYPRSGPFYCKAENCPASDRPFRFLSKLRDHTRSHLPLTFPCPECNLKFKQNRILKKHFAKVHKVKQSEPEAGGNHLTVSDVTNRFLHRPSQMHVLNMESQNQLEDILVEDFFSNFHTFDNDELILFDSEGLEFSPDTYAPQ